MISSPGVGSGLDINSLVSQLVDAQGRPATLRLAQREAGVQSDISSFGLLKSALSDFAGALTTLKAPSTFNARTASSADTTVFTASATSAAAVSSYGIEVVSLAAAHKLTSAGFASTSAVVGSGTLTIKSGPKSASIAIAGTANTLADVRDAINAAASSSGVSATIITVDDGSGGSQSKLVLSADSTGTASAITVTAVDDDLNNTDTSGLSSLVYDPAPGSGVTNLSETQPAADGQIKIDGQTVTSASNTITSAIEGVTLTLVAASPAKTFTLGVTRDDAAIKQDVQDFVDKFNALQTLVVDLTKFDASTGQKGALLGDATVLGISNQIRRELGDVVSGANASYDTLSEIGIRTQIDGTLSFDTTVFDAAVAADSTAVSTLFTSSDGIAVGLDTVVQGILATDGTIDTKLVGLNAQIDDINGQRDALDRSLAALQSRLFSQFQAMDELVSRLQSTSRFLTRQFSVLQGLSSGSSGA